MKKLIPLIFLVLLVVVLFTPFREDIIACRVYDSDNRQYEVWEYPMIRGLNSFPSESEASLPFSLIGGEDNACYTIKWYESLSGVSLIPKPVKSYSLIEKLIILFSR